MLHKNSSKPLINAFISDFFFQAKVKAVADRLGIDLHFVTKRDYSSKELEGTGLVIVDLMLPGTDSLEFLQEIRREFPRSRIVAFGPHVEKGRFKLAQEAGFDEVIPRSKFSKSLSEILSSAGENKD